MIGLIFGKELYIQISLHCCKNPFDAFCKQPDEIQYGMQCTNSHYTDTCSKNGTLKSVVCFFLFRKVLWNCLFTIASSWTSCCKLFCKYEASNVMYECQQNFINLDIMVFCFNFSSSKKATGWFIYWYSWCFRYSY